MNNKYIIPTQELKQVSGQMQAEEILKDVDIVSLLRSFGIEVMDKGESYIAICPFHKAKDQEKPGLSISKEKKIFKCFSCGVNGNLVDFVMKVRNCSPPDALKYIKNKEYAKKKEDKDYVLSVLGKVKEVGLKQTSELIKKGKLLLKKEDKDNKQDKKQEKTTDKEIEIEKVNKEIEQNSTISPSFLLKDVQRYYCTKIGSARSIQFLEKLKLNNLALIGRFNIGFCDGTLLNLLSAKQKEELKRLNILSYEDKEILFNCITVPLFDEHENIINIAGIKIEDKEQITVNANSGIFNRAASRVYPDGVILTGNLIDALYLLNIGFNNVQSLFREQDLDFYIERLKEDRVQIVFLTLDNARIKDRLLSEGFNIKVIASKSLYLLMDKEKIDSLIKESLLIESSIKQHFNAKLNDDGSYTIKIRDLIYTVINVPDIFIGNCKVTIKAYNKANEDSFVDMVELYSSRSRNSYSNILGRNFNIEQKVIERDLNAILSYLEKMRDRKISVKDDTNKMELSEVERQMGMKLLKDPCIMEQIVKDMEDMGYVGDDYAKLLAYLCAVSRRLPRPLSIILLSESSSGKTYLVETVEKLMPEEEVIALTSLTDQALSYVPENELIGKFMTLGEAVYSISVDHKLRDLLSSQRLIRYVAMKDNKTGDIITKPRSVKAKVACAITTTNKGLNQENASRCFVIAIDESIEQTLRIQRAQFKKRSLEFQLTKDYKIDRIREKHISSQRLLKDIMVVNPYESYIKFPATLLRGRRDNESFGVLIDACCYERQFQKERKRVIRDMDKKEIEYIETDLSDYRTAYNIVSNKILPFWINQYSQADIYLYESFRSLSCAKGNKYLLKPEEIGSNLREIWKYSGKSYEWVKFYLRRLVEYELISKKGNKRGEVYYNLKVDEDIGKVDISQLTRPEELEEILYKMGREDLNK